MAPTNRATDELESVLPNDRETEAGEQPVFGVQTYDFRRPDRIAKDQLRAIHVLHENFARSLGNSLSAYLRAYVTVNMVSVEQVSFSEFSHCLPSPTCLVSLKMTPYDGSAVLELNSGLVFPILEMLLGGTGKSAARIEREVTEIEQSILTGLYRIILQDLREAWRAVTNIEFSIDGRETEPQVLQVLAPHEAIVAIALQVRIGENSGRMNLGIPSITVKMLRQKLDQQWCMRKGGSSESDQARMLRLLKPAALRFDARLQGPTLTVESLMNLQKGDVLVFDHPASKPLDVLVNGILKFRGTVGAAGCKKGLLIQEIP